VREVLGVSERRACRTLGQHRSTQRKIPCGLPDEERLTEDIIALTREYGRYGYRMIAGMLNNSGWHVNHKRVERIWRREGLKVPHKQKKKGRLWMNPLRALLRNTLPGNERIMCAASSRETKPRLVL
jgi:putative transposase